MKSGKGSSKTWSGGVGTKFFNRSTGVFFDWIIPLEWRYAHLMSFWNLHEFMASRKLQNARNCENKDLQNIFIWIISYWRWTFYIKHKLIFVYFLKCIQMQIFVPEFAEGCILIQAEDTQHSAVLIFPLSTEGSASTWSHSIWGRFSVLLSKLRQFGWPFFHKRSKVIKKLTFVNGSCKYFFKKLRSMFHRIKILYSLVSLVTTNLCFSQSQLHSFIST